jgi:predicted transcriptional regulator
MPIVNEDSHRGKVCKALSEEEWMDCHEVADSIGYTVDGTSSVLSDVYRAGYVERREAREPGSAEYEYQLKSNVRVE